MSAVKHFNTIIKHKWIVLKYCFRAGLYWQGITHDLSKLSYTEFPVGAKYFQGDKSPNVAERRDKGYSIAWIHHKGRNKHHFEYWYDNNMDGFIPVDMPDRYLTEMLIDRIAACKTYNCADYTDGDPLKYYLRGYDTKIMHPHTKERLELLLHMLAEEGEAKTMKYIRNEFLRSNKKVAAQ